ncbi:hypothetical protein FHT92_002086 [Rhizobium sp. BK377]|jgi:hypothetical protein|nr:hypothetical protein [Rhizobium sp. BK377]
MIYEQRNVADSLKQRKRFEEKAARVLKRHYQRPIAIMFSWQPGNEPHTIDLRAVPQVLTTSDLEALEKRTP